MGTTLRAAEFVLPGHPDKLCDAIADALVQEASRRERRALVGVEVAVHRASLFLTGRIAGEGAETIDLRALVRDVLASAGYGATWHPVPDEVTVQTDLCLGPLDDGEADFRRVSDDQTIVTGYAIDLPGTNYLPPEHWLAARLGLGLERLRIEAPDLRLGPDGKVAVLLEEADGRALRLAALCTSLQQPIGEPCVELHRAVLDVLREELAVAVRAIPGFTPTLPDEVVVNGAGDFSVGGPEGDNGLSGKKLVVDAYGPRVPIGGGALSGKDFYKADRAGALIARRLAKSVVVTGLAHACTTTLAFFPGATEARVLRLEDEAGRVLDPSRWAGLLDLSLAGVGDRYTGAVDLVSIARRGHFTNPTAPWERLRFDAPIGIPAGMVPFLPSGDRAAEIDDLPRVA
jgi:S-adenosylmethionine synthetase